MKWTEMRLPCCKRPLPARLDCVEKVTCVCGQEYLPKVIEEYNELMDLIIGWRSIINSKALIKCEEGEGEFVADIMRRGIKLIESFEHIPNDNRIYKTKHKIIKGVNCCSCGRPKRVQNVAWIYCNIFNDHMLSLAGFDETGELHGCVSYEPKDWKPVTPLTHIDRSNECPNCGSPLEDNGSCSDVGNNNCFYQK